MSQIDLRPSAQLVHSHKYTEALRQLELLHKANPDINDKQILARLHYLTAICLQKLGLNYERALEYYNIALENGFSEFWVRYHRGLLYLKLGELDHAIEDIRRSVELKPDFKDAVTRLKDLQPAENNSISKPKLNSPVIVLSVPKSGTMLLTNILSEIFGEDQIVPSKIFNIGLINENYINALPGLKNKIYVGHVHYSEDIAKKLSKFPKVILLRDPREQVVSLAHFIDKIKNDLFGDEESFWNNLETTENKISAVILGMLCNNSYHNLASVYYTYLNYCLKWIDSKSVVIRYRDIISSQFGGNDSITINTISKILKHLGTIIDEESLKIHIAKGSKPDKSPTFRSGKIHSWKEEFNESHIIQMKTAASNLVSALGYEPNEEWDLRSDDYNVLSNIGEQNKSLFALTDVYSRYCVLQQTVRDNAPLQYLVDGWAFNNLAEQGDYGNLIPITERLLRLLPDNPTINYFHGFCMHTINRDFKTAVNYYNKALENGFDEFWIMYNRGLLYRESGELDRSIEDLRRASDLDPNNDAVKNALALVIQQNDERISKNKRTRP